MTAMKEFVLVHCSSLAMVMIDDWWEYGSAFLQADFWLYLKHG
tara:strand:- start:136 stop:264 length:129 start_codon:yes stop_codon:yes gene_type:complete